MTSLPYELCLELKNAGWPQPAKPDGFGWSDKWVCGESDWLYSPSLEELIEACGDSFDALTRNKIHTKKFRAESIALGSRYFGYDNDDPKVAVARLWLALKREGKV
jgi:hypothetical protein